MEELLVQAGLSDVQASAYLYLLEHGATAPPAVARACNMTRTNAYKVLDSLQDLDLVSKSEVNKKFVYEAADPTALASLVAEQRNQVLALEQNVKTAMHELRAKYRRSTETASVRQARGEQAIIKAYQAQAATDAPIYFVKSRADIPFMGFETMARIRHLGVTKETPRFGITPDAPEINKDPRSDAHTFLTRTIVPTKAYTAPVEWSVSGDELAIITFDGEGSVIRIKDHAIAESFRQIWKLADTNAKR